MSPKDSNTFAVETLLPHNNFNSSRVLEISVFLLSDFLVSNEIAGGEPIVTKSNSLLKLVSTHLKADSQITDGDVNFGSSKTMDAALGSNDKLTNNFCASA